MTHNPSLRQRVVLDLTLAEARAIGSALSQALDATDVEEQLTIFGGGHQRNAAYRASDKLYASIRGNR